MRAVNPFYEEQALVTNKHRQRCSTHEYYAMYTLIVTDSKLFTYIHAIVSSLISEIPYYNETVDSNRANIPRNTLTHTYTY